MNKQITMLAFVALVLPSILPMTLYGMEDNVEFNTEFRRAILQMDMNTIRTLLDEKGDAVNTVNQFGWTFLHIAAMCGSADAAIARLLVEKGADVHAKDEEGWTPLHYVSNPEIANLLIKAGADVNARNNRSQTPLHKAVEYLSGEDHRESLVATGQGKSVMKVVEILLKAVEDPLAHDDANRTSLGIAQEQLAQGKDSMKPVCQLIRGEVKFRKAFLARLFEGGLTNPVKRRENIELPLEMQEMILEKAFPEEAAQRLAARRA